MHVLYNKACYFEVLESYSKYTVCMAVLYHYKRFHHKIFSTQDSSHLPKSPRTTKVSTGPPYAAIHGAPKTLSLGKRGILFKQHNS